MACPCGANSWTNIGAAKCGPIRCTTCGHIASREDVKAYRRAKAEAKAREEER